MTQQSVSSIVMGTIIMCFFFFKKNYFYFQLFFLFFRPYLLSITGFFIVEITILSATSAIDHGRVRAALASSGAETPTFEGDSDAVHNGESNDFMQLEVLNRLWNQTVQVSCFFGKKNIFLKLFLIAFCRN